jgi:hypothetical protein
VSIKSRLEALEVRHHRAHPVVTAGLFLPPFQSRDAAHAIMTLVAYEYRHETDADLVARLRRLPRGEELSPDVPPWIVNQLRTATREQQGESFRHAAEEIMDELRQREQARSTNRAILLRNPKGFTVDWAYKVSDEELQAYLERAVALCAEFGGRPPEGIVARTMRAGLAEVAS